MILRPNSLAHFAAIGIIVLAAALSSADSVRATASFQVLHMFTGGGDGAEPSSALVEAADGNLYGMTARGGAEGLGTIYRISPGGNLITVHAFTAAEGASSSDVLVVGADGSLYGTGKGLASDAPIFGPVQPVKNGTRFGTIFRMSPEGAVTIVHTFKGTPGNPAHALIQASDGSFYGTTDHELGKSAIFKVTSAGEASVVRTFVIVNGEGPPTSLVQAADGTLYGTTLPAGKPANVMTVSFSGNVPNAGTIFRITPYGAYRVLHTLESNLMDTGPITLIQATDGDLYGTTSGGVMTLGSVFRITPNGRFTTLHTFKGADGALPGAALTQGRDGSFFGTTNAGGAAGYGTIFRMTPEGVFTTLYAFETGTRGSFAALAQARDGHLYGIRTSDQTGAVGIVFRLTID